MSLNGGYAMIKYNSTQEELQIAYRSKKPALLYDENQRAHWAVIEEIATESVDEETQEQITLYEYSYRLLDEASGGKLYLHNIILTLSSKKFSTLISLSTSNPISIDDLKHFADLNIKITFISLVTSDVATSDADGIGCVKKLDETTYYFGWKNLPSGTGNANLDDGTITDTLTEV